MTQMMDRNPNKDTQKIRRDTTQKWLYDNPGKTPGRSELIYYFFLTAARKALNKNNIKAAWKQVGMRPWDPSRLNYSCSIIYNS